jgi:hypothetical protein
LDKIYTLLHNINFFNTIGTWQTSVRGQPPQFGDLGVQTVAPDKDLQKLALQIVRHADITL